MIDVPIKRAFILLIESYASDNSRIASTFFTQESVYGMNTLMTTALDIHKYVIADEQGKAVKRIARVFKEIKPETSEFRQLQSLNNTVMT